MIIQSNRDQYWVAIDIGTTKICTLVAGNNSAGVLEILGIGTHPSYGLKKGVVVDIDTTVNSIKQAVAQAEQMSGKKITHATVGISGGHIQSYNSYGVVPIKRKDVSQDDIDRVIDAARAIPIPADREILHVIPQYFKVDDQETVDNSLGMQGVRLEAQVHIITGNIASASNIIKCCELAGVSVVDIVLEHIASAEAVLSEAERNMGVGMLDIGGGTCDFAIYKGGKIRYSKVLPIAGNHFTNDIAVCFRIPLTAAEELKRAYGNVAEELSAENGDLILEVPLDYENEIRQISTRELCAVLNLRAQEVFNLLLDDMLTFKLIPSIRYGLVLTGGGSLLEGMSALSTQTFGVPTRLGIPHNEAHKAIPTLVPDVLKSPIYATAYGLLLYACGKTNMHTTVASDGPLFSRVFKKMKSWIYDFI